jgi:RNA polymerase sigma-70 factor (ECF subfamily)
MKERPVSDADTAIVQAVQGGDTEAFRLLVERHQGRLFAMLMRLLGNPALAEELAHEAFVKAFTALAGFRGDASFGTWLIQIGLHAARDHLRQTRRLRERGIVSLEQLRAARPRLADPADAGRHADPGARLEEEETSASVHQALDQLPAEYREVLVLKHLENWSYEQISASTGDSVGTLKVRAHRARRLLREQLSASGWESGQDASHPRTAGKAADEEVGHGPVD